MGISRLTAAIIEINRVRCEAGGPDLNGKYTGWIMLDVERFHPLLNSDPIYTSKRIATFEMKKVVRQIHETFNQEFKEDKASPAS